MKTLLDALEQRAALDSDRHAYRFFVTGEPDSPQRTRTWGQVWSRATAVAHHLIDRRLAGQRALLLLGDGIDFIDSFFGCLLAGVVAVPVTPPDPSRLDRTLPRLRGIARDCEATVIVTTASIARMAGALRDQAPDLHAMCWIVVDEIAEDEGSAWTRPDAIGSQSLAVLQYTSGSTGSPAGVRITHDNLWSYCDVAKELYRMDRDTRVLTWLPLFHDMGLMGGIVVPTRVGNLYSWMSPTAFLRRPMRWPQLLSSERITFTAGPDFAYALCARKADPARIASLDLSPLRVAVNSAEPVRTASIEAFTRTFAPAGLRLDAMLPAYGLAEATLGITGFPEAVEPRTLTLDADALERGVVEPSRETSGRRELVSCGRPARGLELRIVDPATCTALPERTIGEIWAKGATMSPGYWRAREDERPMHGRLADDDGEPWLRTGDLGLLDRGELFVAGRIKDLIVIRGRNHHPHDIEHSVVDCHPRIRPGCVIASSLELHGHEQLLVAAELDLRGIEPGQHDTLFEQVVAEIRATVGEHHRLRPACITLLPTRTIDKTSSGKLARSRCRRRHRDGSIETLHRWDAPAPHARDEALPHGVEAWLFDRLSELSGVDCRVAPQRDTSFQRLGLDSLSLVSLAGELEQRLDRTFETALLYDHATPSALLAFLRADHSSTQSEAHRSQAPIAIIGMACRTPGGVNSPEQLWQLLHEQRDAIGDAPTDREWDADAVGTGGFLEQIDRFDAAFFGIHPREADWLDPQQRVLLECSWEALEDATVDPSTLRGRDVGVYMGIAAADYQQLALRVPERLEAWSALGMSHAASVGRISHVLGLEGPNLAIDTACSSSLVAIHQASQALRAGECSAALAGGVNLVCSADGTRAMRALGALSATGRCRAFGADADGYVRGEGCGVVVLKPLADAVRDGDPIRAVLEGSAVNQDGASNGFTAPRGSAQQAVVRAALAGAQRSPDEIEYVEAHGTGTPLGDPIEATALAVVFGARTTPLPLGSIKSNIGHTEAAAGVLGLLKAVLAVEHRLVPPSLHATPPNPQLQSLEGQISVCSSAHRLEGGPVGISSFGFSGTNAHVVIGPWPAHSRDEAARSPRPLLWVLSARTPRMLEQHARQVASFLAREDRDDLDLAWTLACGRRHLPARLAVVASSAREAAVLIEQRRSSPDMPSAVAATDERLHEAARLFERGSELPWPDLFGDGPTPSRLSGLPLQPFERRRHWLPQPTNGAPSPAAYYDALDTAVVDPATTHLTFGPLATTPPGFSWLRTFLEPERHPDHVRLAERAQQDLRRLLWEGLPEHPQRVLDVGCGYGTDLLTLARTEPTLTGIGLTLSEAQAARARETIERAGLSARLDVRRGDSTSTPLEGPFDVVLGFEVVHHIRDKRSLFEHVAQHLAPDGRWLLADFVTTTPGTIEHPLTSSWFIDAQTWSTLLAEQHLRLDVAIDVSGGIARFLRDDDFDAVLADHPWLADHPELLASFESYRGLGTLLARGDARYVVLHATHRPDVDSDDLREHNRFTLEHPTDWHATEPTAEPTSRATAPPVASVVDLERIVHAELATLLERPLDASALDASWSELGVDSLLSIEFQQRLSLLLDSAVDTSELTSVRGPRELIASLQQGADPNPAPAPDSHRASPSLPEDFPAVRAPAITAQTLERPEHLLVTGGTGFVGAFLIGALLRRTEARLHVLVRGDDIAGARERLRTNLLRHGILEPLDERWSRLEVLVGDLALPRLGLDATTWTSLANTLDGIVHSGARLSYVLGLEQLAAPNVEGTKTLLALAAGSSRPCPFHFVSTLAVFESAATGESMDERSVPPHDGRFVLGYSQSKAMAEAAVMEAAAAGLPVTIHRPGLIGGSLEGGSWNGDDFTCRLLHGVIEHGVLPQLDLELDLVPVDVLADGIVALALHAPALGHAWHHRSPTPMPLDALQDWLQQRGHRVERVPATRWAQRLATEGARPTHALRGLLPFFVERDAIDGSTGFERYARALPGSADRTRAVLRELNARLPPSVASMLVGRCGDGLQWLLPTPSSRR